MSPTLQLMLIRAYGEWWDPTFVEWGRKGPGNKGKLSGTFAQTETNVWDQRGIYVLLQDWQVVYVGKTGSMSLGTRLRTHYFSDDVAGRWDRFSWYGYRRINKNGELSSVALPTTQLKADVAL